MWRLRAQLAEHNDDELFDTFAGKVPALVARDEASYVQAALQAYRTANVNSALPLRELRHWMPQVTRFSFRSGSW